VRGRLGRTVTWRSAIVVTLGATLLVTVSLGAMAEALGTAVPFVWLGVALVGGLQCLLLIELARAYPDRAGGTAMYAHPVLGRRAPIVAAASSWGYWLAWTPGIAVNLILAGTYLHATVWPSVGVVPLALAIGIALYGLNGMGLRVSMRAAAVVAVIALVPLAVILVGALLQPSLLDLGRLAPVTLGHASLLELDGWLLLAKWTFVVAWSAYGAEMASTVVAETRFGREHASRALLTAAAVGLVGFGLLPFLILTIVGAGGLAQEPLVAFLPVADAVLGEAGRDVVGVMLAAGLVLGAQAFIVGSSRTIYQMAHDGHLPRQFAAVNRRGVPIGSLMLDATAIAVLLGIFGTHVVDVVAAANVGYLVVFVVLPIAFIVHRGGARSALGAVAVGLGVLNALLLVVGGLQWGSTVVLTGAAAMAMIVPISLVRRWQDRRAGRTSLLPFPSGEPLDELLEEAGA
jgi:amino acid transporter